MIIVIRVSLKSKLDINKSTKRDDFKFKMTCKEAFNCYYKIKRPRDKEE